MAITAINEREYRKIKQANKANIQSTNDVLKLSESQYQDICESKVKGKTNQNKKLKNGLIGTSIARSVAGTLFPKKHK